MADRAMVCASVGALIEPRNTKGIAPTRSRIFAGDPEWDSLIVMDFVASIENGSDIVIAT